ncbi:MAG: DUF2796 domain-containing protein [Pseudomonadota bacterium]
MNVTGLALVTVSALALIAAQATAQETRELGAHEHGVGELDIAIEGDQMVMELHVPGADIVGFEYAPEAEADKATVAAALETLEAPLSLFVLPDAAGCTVVEASAELEIEGEEDQDDHDHGEDHADDHDDHDEDHAADHDDHDDHDEDHAAEHDDHDDHDDHDAAEAGGSHSEFHAEYVVACSDMSAADQIDFAYFSSFPNAQELEIQLVTDTGAHAFEVERQSGPLSLAGHM